MAILEQDNAREKRSVLKGFDNLPTRSAPQDLKETRGTSVDTGVMKQGVTSQEHSGGILGLSQLRGRDTQQQEDVGQAPTAQPVAQPSQGQSMIQQGIQRTEDIMRGNDPVVDRMEREALERSAATQAALRGARQQEMSQAGIDGVTGQIMANIQDRQAASQQAETLGTIGDIRSQREEQAAQLNLQLGQHQVGQERQAYEEYISNADLTDPNQLRQAQNMAESIYGTSPTFSQAIDQQWNAKTAQAKSRASGWILENEALLYDASGDFNPDRALQDPDFMRRMENMYEAETRGSEEFNPDNPVVQNWIRDRVEAMTTTEQELDFKRTESQIRQSDWFNSLDEQQQAQMLGGLESLMTMGFKTDFADDGQFKLVDAGGNELFGSDMYRLGEGITGVKDDAEKAFVVTDSNGDMSEFNYKNGKWVNEEGAEITDSNPYFDTLQGISTDWEGGEIGQVVDSLKDFPDASSASQRQWNELADDVAGGDVSEDDWLLHVEDGIKDGSIPDSAMRRIMGSEEASQRVKEVAPAVDSTKKSGDNRKWYRGLEDNMGSWVNWDGEIVYVEDSSKKDDRSFFNFNPDYWTEYTLRRPDGTTFKVST